jgi:hypothetical protein
MLSDKDALRESQKKLLAPRSPNSQVFPRCLWDGSGKDLGKGRFTSGKGAMAEPGQEGIKEGGRGGGGGGGYVEMEGWRERGVG